MTDFQGDLDWSDNAIYQNDIQKYLRVTHHATSFKDISKTPRGIQDDIDLLISYDARPPWQSVEVKCRQMEFAKYNDVLVELKSSIEAATLGWLLKSKAYMLLYIFLLDSEIPQPRDVWGRTFSMRGLREYWQRQGEKNVCRWCVLPEHNHKHTGFPKIIGKTHSPEGKILYHTENWAIPLRVLEGLNPPVCLPEFQQEVE